MESRMRTTGAGLRSSVAALAVAVGMAGCSDLLSVRLPGSVPAELFDDPAYANTIVQSAIGDFECAYANYVFVTAYWTNEIIHAVQNLENRQWSQRQISEEHGSLLGSCGARWGTFRTLHAARVQAEEAAQRFSQWDLPNGASLSAQAEAYAGYSTLLLGEAYCEMTMDGGPLMTRAQVFERAEQRFTAAIEHAQVASNAEILNMARVGRARARINLGRAGDAASDAALVPVGFVKYADRGLEHARRYNWIWTANNNESSVTVDFDYRGVTWEGVPDPRVPAVDGQRWGTSGETYIWDQRKYLARDSPIPLASWEEAQLIMAEAAGGQAAVDIINVLHARVDLPPFHSTDPDEIRAQVIEERRRELWLEGHRINDMLRFDLPWRSGLDHQNQPYGSATCLPLPLIERTGNPNVSG